MAGSPGFAASAAGSALWTAGSGLTLSALAGGVTGGGPATAAFRETGRRGGASTGAGAGGAGGAGGVTWTGATGATSAVTGGRFAGAFAGAFSFLTTSFFTTFLGAALRGALAGLAVLRARAGAAAFRAGFRGPAVAFRAVLRAAARAGGRAFFRAGADLVFFIVPRPPFAAPARFGALDFLVAMRIPPGARPRPRKWQASSGLHQKGPVRIPKGYSGRSLLDRSLVVFSTFAESCGSLRPATWTEHRACRSRKKLPMLSTLLRDFRVACLLPAHPPWVLLRA